MALYNLPKNKYHPEYADKLLDLMSNNGYSNLELAAKFKITEQCFYDWRKKHQEFQEAYAIGDPQRFAYLMEQADKLFYKNDKGYKHWVKKLQNIYKNYSPDAASQGTTNNIQISNMNVIAGKTALELEEILKQKYLQINRIKPLDVIDAKVIDESDTNDRNI